MRHLDLSFEGKYLAEKNQLDNGKLPHGGYRGSKKHPPSHLSYDKGREFQQRLEEELSRIMEVDDMTKHGGSPPWSILVHNSPSYTDESPLITNSLLAASKTAQINGINLYNRTSLLPKKCPRPAHLEGGAYYRPNRMHQYLSATELKNSASEDASVKYGRPTRTTLLRARQRSNSAPLNQLDKKKDFAQRLDEIKTAPAGPVQTTEYLQLQSVRDGESLHSYLTGARYNRAHCLDSKSVEHTGVYMPRHNPALGMFFTGPKGQEYLQEFEESPRQDFPTPPTPPTGKRRPLTAPSYGRRPFHATAPAPYKPEHPVSSKYKYLKLNIVGSRLPIVNTREAQQQFGLRLPKLSEVANLSDRRLDDALDQTYLVNQPMPTPSGVEHVVSRHSRIEAELPVDSEYARFMKREEGEANLGAIRIEGRSTWKVRQLEPSSDLEEEEERVAAVPVVEEEGEKSPQREDIAEEEEKKLEEETEADRNEEKLEVHEVREVPQEVQEEKQEQDENIEREINVQGESTEIRDKEEEDADVIPDVEVQKKSESEPPVLETGEETVEEETDERENEVEEPEEKDVENEVPIAENTNEDSVDVQEVGNDDIDVDDKKEEEEEKEEEVPSTLVEGENAKEEESAKPGEENVLFFITEDGFASDKLAQDTVPVTDPTQQEIDDGRTASSQD